MRTVTWVLLVVAFAAGIALIPTRDRLAPVQSKQLLEYNGGLRAYRNGQHDVAVEYFQRSVDEYKASLVSTPELLTVRKISPSRLYAGLALHHMAKAFIKLERPLDALNAFLASQQINPGDYYDPGLSPAEIRDLFIASADCKRNMEKFLKDNPQLAGGLRSGPSGPKGSQPSPGNDPNKGRNAKGRPQDDI
jgi:tetratricopeptide (TPR) repeat protein